MKLRYFYFLCSLVCIDWTFCYEFTDNGKAVGRNEHLKRNPKPKQGRQKKQHRRWRRQEYDEEKDPVASVDVASFIQQPDPDYESIDDPGQFKKRRRPSKDYDEFSSLSDLQVSLENTKKENQNNYLEDSNMMHNNDKIQDGLENTLSQGAYDKNTLDADLLAEKDKITKHSRRRQAIPFFSHKTKEKKHKKRKIFNFLSKTTSTTLLPKFDGPKPDLKNHLNKLAKRSNFERFCPLCKRRMLPKQPPSRKIIHNSKQYYRNHGDVSRIKKKKEPPNNVLQNSKLGERLSVERETDIRVRNKREKQDYDDGPEEFEVRESQHTKRDEVNKERQLKELEEIQRKVDNLEINFPADYMKYYLDKKKTL